MKLTESITRRESITRISAASAALLGLRGARAATRERTMSQAEGPYYPVTKPAPVSNDLLHGPNGKRAEGRPLALSGRVHDTAGKPIPGVRVEIWQCDNRAIYRHPRAPGVGNADPLFPGYGESTTNASGEYSFLTIVPVAYPGRPPHIHAKLKAAGDTNLTTQLYIAGHPDNDGDGLLARLLHGSREGLMMSLSATKLAGGIEGMSARFDFVV